MRLKRGYSDYEFPADAVALMDAVLMATPCPYTLMQVHPEQMESLLAEDSQPPTMPQYFAHYPERIVFYPKPDKAYRITVRYTAMKRR